jgi:hypothetical protein
MILLLLCVFWLVEMYNKWKFVAYARYKTILWICAQQCKKTTLNKLIQLMEHSMASPSINMILLLTRTILDGEITRTYTMGTYLNKTIKADSSTPWMLAPIELSSEIAPCIYKFQLYGIIKWWSLWDDENLSF